MRACKTQGYMSKPACPLVTCHLIATDPNVTCTDGDVRLMGGARDNEGRVEICYENHWGALCDNQWDNNDGMVVCRQLGFNTNGKKPHLFLIFRNRYVCCFLEYFVITFCAGVIARGGGYFGNGRGTIHLDYLNCTGSEQKLKECGHSGFGNTNCYSFEEDAGVICPGIIVSF